MQHQNQKLKSDTRQQSSIKDDSMTAREAGNTARGLVALGEKILTENFKKGKLK